MKKHMKRFTIKVGFVSIIFLGIALANVFADGMRSQNTQRATGDQNALVASILSKYDASSLTVEDAKAINNAFRNAGIRRGPGQQEAIEAAGFDPRKISSLDPPPDRARQGDQSKSSNYDKIQTKP